jgi:ATP-dependent exoDNAse (exonuclease V) beta subunit
MVRFGEKCQSDLSVAPETVQLTENYRSHKGIVEWVNRFVGHHQDLPSRARTAKKGQLKAAADIGSMYPAVSAILGESREASAEMMAHYVQYLIDEDIIEDYSQIALLLRSTKESPRNAQAFVEALKSQDIPIYNPRNKALTDQDEVQLALGTLIVLLDREAAVRNMDYVQGRFLGDVQSWVNHFNSYIESDGDEIVAYIENSHAKLDALEPGEPLETVQDVFYRILSLEPFSTWREEDPNRAIRLGRLSTLLDAYTNIYDGNLRASQHVDGHFSHGFLKGFYYNFLQFVATEGFNDPEDPYDQIPRGMIQVMTVHQAKGLEFPVVFAGDINKRDTPDGTHFMENELAPYSGLSIDSSPDERAGHDNVRRFFVQYSRAQDHLVLVGKRDNVKSIALGNDKHGNRITAEWFDEHGVMMETQADFDAYAGIERKFDANSGPRRRYSVTGDILSFRRCARQYGHFTDLGFAPAGSGQLYFGKVVHGTLDRIHQQYKGQIVGKPAEVVPDDDTVREYFDQVSRSLITRGVYPMSRASKDKSLEYILRFNQQMGEQLYPVVKDTEHQLKRQHQDFVLEGTVDVLARSSDAGESPGAWEIWDYKATQVPDADAPDMKNYRFQMQVYAGLFELKNGTLPSKAVLYFLGADDPETATVEVPFSRDSIDHAVSLFSRTVAAIEDSRREESWPAPSADDAPTIVTCDGCDLRWDCPTVEGKYPIRTP